MLLGFLHSRNLRIFELNGRKSAENRYAYLELALFGVNFLNYAREAEERPFVYLDRFADLEGNLGPFGAFGLRLHSLCRGEDERPVSPDLPRKSISVETTYDVDLATPEACQAALAELLPLLTQRIARAAAGPLVHKAFVKIKFDNFRQTTVETVHGEVTPAVFGELLDTGWQRHRRPVRLLGAGVRLVEAGDTAQLGLFGEPPVPVA